MAALSLEGEPQGSNFVMYDEDAPVALMRTHIEFDAEPALVIDGVYFKNEVSAEDRKLFLHAMFFKLREGTPIMIKADDSDELKPFGFEKSEDGRAQLFSGDINLYYNCGGKRNG